MPTLTWSLAATAHLEPAFKATLPNEHVYAQPLYWVPPRAAHGLVIVATMSNTVRAFDAGDGHQVWAQTAIGAPVPQSFMPCSGQNPWGIASTPVIDPVAAVMYFDAEVLIQKVPKHQIWALSLVDGSPVSGWPIDVENSLLAKGILFSSTVQGQRSALTLVNGNVYVAYGGHGGDCGTYHGWVLGVQTATPGIFGAWSTRALKGAIWSPGGVAYDGRSLFVSTGNSARHTTTWQDGEAVINLDPTLTTELDYYAPSDWKTLDALDLDLGGTAPLPIDVPYRKDPVRQWMVALGKNGDAYLLDRNKMGGIGGQLAFQPVATSELKTAPVAYQSSHTVFVAFNGAGSNCPTPQASVALTVLAVNVAPTPGFRTAWCASLLSTGSPMVTTIDGLGQPIVWIAGVEGDGLLHGYAGTDGHVVFGGGGSADQMFGMERFSTILAAENRLYIAGSKQLYAFSFGP